VSDLRLVSDFEDGGFEVDLGARPVSIPLDEVRVPLSYYSISSGCVFARRACLGGKGFSLVCLNPLAFLRQLLFLQFV
jgi:hypothetical protein